MGHIIIESHFGKEEIMRIIKQIEEKTNLEIKIMRKKAKKNNKEVEDFVDNTLRTKWHVWEKLIRLAQKEEEKNK